MRLDDLGESLYTIGPDANSLIGRAGDNLVSIWRHTYAMNCTFVSHEAERAHHWLEVPDHDSAVE